MRYSEPDTPDTELGGPSTAEQLRRENEELRRQLSELRGLSHGSEHGHSGVPARLWHPSRLTIVALALSVVVLLAIAFIAGYLPLHARSNLIVNEAVEREKSLPRVEVITVSRSGRDSGLQLPGNIQAVTEAPILARADGYIRRRLADIGDRVRSGQMLAEIEAPELDEQVRQAEAALQQAQAGVDQAKANLQQGQSDMELAGVTAKRWGNLVNDGSVSAQENDQFQAQYKSKIAAVHSLEQALEGQQHGVGAAQANLARVQQMKSYRMVVAPFDGVITLRNIDSGALVNNGSTLLFRIAQTGTLRIYLNVPQSHAGSIHKGDGASVTVSNLPGRKFAGAVARTADALDPASRTLLVEVHVPNPKSELLPGMYAQVDLSSSRANPPLIIPSNALIVSSDGIQVAMVKPDRHLHLQSLTVGRDYGDRIEVASGLQVGDQIVASPSDVLHEGVEVEPVAVKVASAH